jgi:hypothetical protein
MDCALDVLDVLDALDDELDSYSLFLQVRVQVQEQTLHVVGE